MEFSRLKIISKFRLINLFLIDCFKVTSNMSTINVLIDLPKEMYGNTKMCGVKIEYL